MMKEERTAHPRGAGRCYAKGSLAVATVTGLVAVGCLLVAPFRTAQPAAAPAATTVKHAPAAAPTKNTRHHARVGLPESGRQYYEMMWGVDQLSVKLAESGQLVRFSYRVVDTGKAAPLHDKVSSPQLLDEKARVVLQIPNMEKVGPLRQATAPEGGKSYWMLFSNKGNHVKAGHLVSVVIGSFRVDGLIVQ